MKKSALILLAVVMTFMVQTVFANENMIEFTDVDSSTPLGKDVSILAGAGIVSGNGDGTFTPQNPVTRAELCKMINNIWKFTLADETGFYDVTPDKWYYNHVIIGKKAGYINGFEDGSFRGDDYITREQVCAIICRVAGLYELDMGVSIADEVSDWAVPYVTRVVENKLMPLESGNTFRATENMTRGEVASVLAGFVYDTQLDIPTQNPDNDELDESKMSAVEIVAANQEVIAYLKDINSDLENVEFSGKTAEIIGVVMKCIENAIGVGESGERLITRDFVYKNYETEISGAKKAYGNLSEEERSEFIETVASNAKSKTLSYLMEVFL